ncbi:MAG: laminin G domain-containing protein [Sedimentisphaerales bacterium]|nr:laminin G domain-containing protein [Sedimentisphaerales bacterium]
MKQRILYIVMAMILAVLCYNTAQGDLLLHWKLDDSIGATTAADSSPLQEYPGTVHDTGGFAFGEAGVDGTAAYFPGGTAGSYIDSLDATAQGNPDFRGSDFTVSFWVKSDNAGTSYPLSFDYYVDPEYGWLFVYRATPNMTYRLQDGTSVYDFQTPISSTEWAHIVMTAAWEADVEGQPYSLVTRKCYMNGELLDAATGIPYGTLPDVTPGSFSAGCRQGPDYPRYFRGWIDDVQYYDQTLDAGAVKYLYDNPGAVINLVTGFIPDDFEDYADNTELATLWSTTSGTIGLETTEVQAGSQALRVQTASAGTVTKTYPFVPDYSDKDGMDIVLWYKGSAGNPAGDLTVRVKDSGGAVAVQETVTGATQTADWTELRMERNLGDPNDLTTMELVVSTAATMYFDSISFQTPLDTVPEAILEWRLDESSGTTAADSTIYSNDGTLGSWFTDSQWVVDGGNSGDPGDNALSFVGAGNNVDAEVLSGTLSPDISNHNSYGINVWVKLNSTTVDTKIILGGVGDVWSDPGAAPNLLPRYIVIDGDTLEPELLRGWSGTAWYYNGFADTITLNEWHMLTVVCNGWTNTIDMYIDGVPTRTMSLADCGFIDASVAALSPDVFGETQFTAPDGMIDDFTVWKGILPAQGDAPSVLSLWGSYICPTPLTYDFNGDCITDLEDFAIFAASWLECNRIPVSFCN